MFTGSSGANIAQQAHHLHLYHQHQHHQHHQQQHHHQFPSEATTNLNGYLNGGTAASQRDSASSHQLSALPEGLPQVLLQNPTNGQPPPPPPPPQQVYQQFRGASSELFSMASQSGPASYHQQPAAASSAAANFASSITVPPPYLDTTNQSLVAHFSQHSTVALTGPGALADGISMSNQFVSVMQQQQQQQHHNQQHTPHLEPSDVMNQSALFFHHHHHHHNHHHATHHQVTTTTTTQHHLHTNHSSPASLAAGPHLTQLHHQHQHHLQQQHHNHHHQHQHQHPLHQQQQPPQNALENPLPRPRSSNATLMSTAGAFEGLCLDASSSNSLSQSIVLDPPGNSVIKVHHVKAAGDEASTSLPTSIPGGTGATLIATCRPTLVTSSNKLNGSSDIPNQRHYLSTNGAVHNYNTTRDNCSIQLEKLGIGALSGGQNPVILNHLPGDNSNDIIIINNNNSITSKPTSNNSTSKNGRISSKLQEKPDIARKGGESARRTFACPTCSKGFTEKFNMKRHMQIHSQLRPKYICNECSKSFAWKDNFIRHRKAAHVASLAQYQV